MNAARLVILGASGDLTGRYLLRAVAELHSAGLLPGGLDIVGVGRDDWDDERFRHFAAGRLSRHAPDLPDTVRDDVVARLRYRHGDATDADALRAAVADVSGPVLVYLALPPFVFAPAISALAVSHLPAGSRIVVEKPFGTDLGSARQLNALLHRHFAEEAVFRIDHFLGKQTVQNVLGLRFANRVFEPLWCSEHIDSVDIVWDESVALEGRAGYYDHTGALRDMIQNHLLQLLTFVAMERPSGLGERPLRDAKVAVLRAVETVDDDAVRRHTVRARYSAGTVDGRAVPNYTDEPGVDPARDTETYASVTLGIDNERWRGVPFRLRTGKALARNRREIRVRFRAVERLPFGQATEPGPNVLTLAMDPDQLAIDIALNGAGDPFCLDPARISLALAPQELSAYARLLVDAIEGDPVLSTRGDEAEESWRIVEPILGAWDGAVPLLTYPAGSDGPAQPRPGGDDP
ncbi:MAG TPA: glucose-6-phosphate dehydrogenase [Acidimicrobiales bacterium]|nr:glucose-6-phosphate dehydrogenase [Acidimicrobiales bacterium]